MGNHACVVCRINIYTDAPVFVTTIFTCGTLDAIVSQRAAIDFHAVFIRGVTRIEHGLSGLPGSECSTQYVIFWRDRCAERARLRMSPKPQVWIMEKDKLCHGRADCGLPRGEVPPSGTRHCQMTDQKL